MTKMYIKNTFLYGKNTKTYGFSTKVIFKLARLCENSPLASGGCFNAEHAEIAEFFIWLFCCFVLFSVLKSGRTHLRGKGAYSG